jgi:hypothetical protein
VRHQVVLVQRLVQVLVGHQEGAQRPDLGVDDDVPGVEGPGGVQRGNRPEQRQRRLRVGPRRRGVVAPQRGQLGQRVERLRHHQPAVWRAQQVQRAGAEGLQQPPFGELAVGGDGGHPRSAVRGQGVCDELQHLGEAHPLQLCRGVRQGRRAAEQLLPGDVDADHVQRLDRRGSRNQQATRAGGDRLLQCELRRAGQHDPPGADRLHTGTELRRLATAEQPPLTLLGRAQLGRRPRLGIAAHSRSASVRIASPWSGETFTHTPRVCAATAANRHSGPNPDPALRT